MLDYTYYPEIENQYLKLKADLRVMKNKWFMNKLENKNFKLIGEHISELEKEILKARNILKQAKF